MVDIKLLYLLEKKENYLRYKNSIKSNAITSVTKNILNSLEVYFKLPSSGDTIDWSGFSTWFCITQIARITGSDLSTYQAVFTNLQRMVGEPYDPTILSVLDEMACAASVADTALQVIERQEGASLAAIADTLREYNDKHSSRTGVDPRLMAGSLADLITELVRTGGYEWRLENLNISVGPLHAGDLVVVAGRPECGKTSFALSEIVHMAKQLPEGKKALVFNNEEKGRKLLLRLYQCALDKTIPELEGDEAAAQAEFDKEVGRDRIIVVHDTSMVAGDIETLCREHNAGLIVINILDKVTGIKDDEHEVERLRALFGWARRLADTYGPVLAMHQADGTAEGQKWLHKGQLYGSKTGVQGEADVIITIGHTHDIAERDYRFIHVPKNKLPGGPRTVASEKHGYHQVRFKQETGVFLPA